MVPGVVDTVTSEIIKRLDRIIELLELQTFVPEDTVPHCAHEHTQDLSTMGMAPKSVIHCLDCGETIRRL